MSDQGSRPHADAFPYVFQLPPASEHLELEMEKPYPWMRYEVRDDETTIAVVISFGPPWAFRRIDVHESASQVVVTVFLGVSAHVAEALTAGHSVPALSVLLHALAEVRLERPLGPRTVVDGAMGVA